MLLVMGSMLGVPGAELRRDQDLQGLAHQLVASIAKHIFGNPVQEDNPAIRIDLNNGVRSRL